MQSSIPVNLYMDSIEPEIRERSEKNLESQKITETLPKSATYGELNDSLADPPLTLTRFVLLFSLTLLWLSAVAPVFLITASIGNGLLELK